MNSNYPIRKEFQKYAHLRLGNLSPTMLAVANALMPVIQRGKSLDRRLVRRKVQLPNCRAELLRPKEGSGLPLLIYYHGGGFMLKAAAYHKNLAQRYALAGCGVLFVDYRLAPRHPFPAPVLDCFSAYQWALENPDYSKILVGGDSAGGALALAVTRLAQQRNLPLPQGQLLIYPVTDAAMTTESMTRFTDTPLWNSVQNRRMWELYTSPRDRTNPLASPMAAESFAGFPPTYIETAEFDCLHDEGVALARRLQADGVPVILQETRGTIHGYDIEENAPFVRDCVTRRVEALKQLMNEQEESS